MSQEVPAFWEKKVVLNLLKHNYHVTGVDIENQISFTQTLKKSFRT